MEEIYEEKQQKFLIPRTISERSTGKNTSVAVPVCTLVSWDGSHSDDGIYVLLKEAMDNSIDEYMMGYGKTIEVTVVDGKVSVRDHGRGIPLGKVVMFLLK